VNIVIVLVIFVNAVWSVSFHMVFWPKGSFWCKRFYCTFRKISIVTRMSRVRYTAGSQAVSVVSLPPSMLPDIIVYCCIVIWKALKGESAKSGFELNLSGVEGEYAERVLTTKCGIVRLLFIYCTMFGVMIVSCILDGMFFALKGESAKSGFELHLTGVEWEYAERVLTTMGGIVSLLIIYCTLFDVTFVSCRVDGMLFVRLRQIAYRGSREPCQHQNGGNI